MYRRIPVEIWGEDWFLNLSRPAKLFYLWASSSRHLTACGAVLIGRRIMAFESGLTDQELSDALTALYPAIEYIDGYLVFPAFVERNNGGTNWGKAASVGIRCLPDGIRAKVEKSVLAVMASEPRAKKGTSAPMASEPIVSVSVSTPISVPTPGSSSSSPPPDLRVVPKEEEDDEDGASKSSGVERKAEKELIRGTLLGKPAPFWTDPKPDRVGDAAWRVFAFWASTLGKEPVPGNALTDSAYHSIQVVLTQWSEYGAEKLITAKAAENKAKAGRSGWEVRDSLEAIFHQDEIERAVHNGINEIVGDDQINDSLAEISAAIAKGEQPERWRSRFGESALAAVGGWERVQAAPIAKRTLVLQQAVAWMRKEQKRPRL